VSEQAVVEMAIETTAYDEEVSGLMRKSASVFDAEMRWIVSKSFA
jgi:hypothetical protein